ncbi:MAG: hypothetical protein HY553_13860 [Elusimicrobia bacterium]|nr:hypothetical protein [Elusimicrobiota bacterium]
MTLNESLETKTVRRSAAAGLAAAVLAGIGLAVHSASRPPVEPAFEWSGPLRDAPSARFGVGPAPSSPRPFGLPGSAAMAAPDPLLATRSYPAPNVRPAPSPVLAAAGPAAAAPAGARDLRTMSFSAGGEGAGGSGYGAGGAGSGQAAGAGAAAPADSSGSAGRTGTIGRVARRATGLAGRGLRRIASALGLGARAGGAAPVRTAPGLAAASSSEAASPSSGSAPAGGPGASAPTSLVPPPAVGDARDVSSGGASGQASPRSGPPAPAAAQAPRPPVIDTPLGRCIAQPGENARCHGYTCAASDARSVREALMPAFYSGFERGGNVLKAAKTLIQDRRNILRPWAGRLRGLRATCINCPKMNGCLDAAAAKLDNAVAELDGAEADLERGIVWLRGETVQAIGTGGIVYRARSRELAAVNLQLSPLLDRIEEFSSSCVDGIPALVGQPPQPEPAGASAKDAFLAVVDPLRRDVDQARRVLQPAWCARAGGCAEPDTAEARRLLADHLDTLKVLDEVLRAGDGARMRDAERSLASARRAFSSSEDTAFFSGLYQLWVAQNDLDEGMRDWRRSAEGVCSQ